MKKIPIKTIEAPEIWRSRRLSFYVSSVAHLHREIQTGAEDWRIKFSKQWVYRALFAPFGWREGWETWHRFGCWTTRN